MDLADLAVLRRTPRCRHPFGYLVVRDFSRRAFSSAALRDFPFHPVT